MSYLHVIMPISSDPLYEAKASIIQELARQNKIKVWLPNPIPTCESSYFDLTKLVAKLQEASFVVVDLSFERPSCYYELGVVETLKKDVYLIAESGTKIHQTGKKDEVYFYRDLGDYKLFFQKLTLASNFTC